MLFLFFIQLCLADLPECRWVADDPICFADCFPICKPAECTYQCKNDDPPRRCFAPTCKTDCRAAVNSSVTTAPPMCETKCDPLICLTNEKGNCQILCEAPNCGWLCDKPNNCQPPRFELQCEKPAFEFSGSSKNALTATMILVALINLIVG